MKNRSSGAARLAVAGLVAAAVAAAVAFAESAVAKPKRDPRTYDLKKKILGKRAGDWVVEWYQWFYSIPASVHPVIDTTGQFVEVGQFGPVWFLGGRFGPTPPDRTATIPTGRSLFFPLINAQFDALDNPGKTTYEEFRAQAAEAINEVDAATMTCTLDGSPITGLDRMRIVSPSFEYHVPEDNVYSVQGNVVNRGIFKPAAADGYWVFLKPLAAGEHVIAFSVNGGLQSATYRLTVVDHNRP